MAVLHALVSMGWTRIRHYPRTGWTVNACSLDPGHRTLVTELFRNLYGTQISFEEIRLDTPAGRFWHDVAWVVDGGLLRGIPAFPGPPHLIPIQGPDEIPDKEVIPVALPLS